MPSIAAYLQPLPGCGGSRKGLKFPGCGQGWITQCARCKPNEEVFSERSEVKSQEHELREF